MKSIYIKLLGAAGALLVSAGLQAGSLEGDQIYVGGGAGATIFTKAADLIDYSSVTKSDFQDTSLGGRLYGGLRFGNGFAIEASYYHFGTAESTTYWSDETDKEDITVTGIGAAVRYDYEFMPKMNVYGKIGMMRWRLSDVLGVSFYTNGTLTEHYRDSAAYRDSDMFAVIGAGYDLSPKLHLFADVTYIELTFADSDFKYPAYSVFAGVEYRFDPFQSGSWTGAEKQDGRARGITACDPKYKDIGGVACEQ